MDQQKDDSNVSSEEIDSPDQVCDDAGTAGRSYYECTFCKGGFTNAQALGGHMNIHRRDRAKYRQRHYSLVFDTTVDEKSENHPYQVQFANQRPAAYYPVYEASNNYRSYFPPSTPDARETRVFHGQDSAPYSRRPQELDLSLYVGGHRSVDDDDDDEDEKMQEEDCNLDLELRLGHWH